jgi:hypothetical protein
MHHRAQLMGAAFQLDSQTGSGTVATIRLPLKQNTELEPAAPAKTVHYD